MRKTALAVTLILAAFPASAQMPALFGQQPIDSLTPAQIRHLQQQMTPRPAAKFMPRPKTATPRPAPAELLGPNPKVPGLAGARLGGGLGGYVVKDGNGNIQTFFSFQCQSGWNCPGQVLIDDTGAEKATPSNPLRVDPTGTTPQPVTQSGSWTLAGGAANGAVPVGNPVWIAGWDGTDVRALSTNNAGVLNTTVAQASAASLNATLAVFWSIPSISNIILAGLMTQTQASGAPFPLPIRVSAGFLVMGLSGKTRIQSFPPRLTWRWMATRLASI